MSHTLETAIAFPIVFAGIVMLISAGPILYKETADAAVFHVAAVRKSIDNHSLYATYKLENGVTSNEIVCTSPERMHFFVRAVEDSAKFLIGGVTTP
jgi:hypothetical protein